MNDEEEEKNKEKGLADKYPNQIKMSKQRKIMPQVDAVPGITI